MTGNAFTDATCVGIARENWNVKTFQFSLTQSPATFGFKAGQYVTLGLDIDGEKMYRCYTVSSAPQAREDSLFEVTVKHSPGGPVSTWLHNRLTVGAKLEVSRPTGDFVLPEDNHDPLLFVAGGVGITPLMSMARAINACSQRRDIQFLQFARTPDDILFRDELFAMSRSSHGITPHFYTSRASDAECAAGRLSIDILDRAVPDWKARRVYCCGPESFMSTMRSLYLESGGTPSSFHQESFDLPEQPVMHAPASLGISSIRLSQSGLAVNCAPGSTILDAVHAAPHGPRIPNACRSGVCGTCKLHMLEGQVEMNHNGGITDDEVEEGYILTCCSIPLSDVTIDY